MRVPPVPVLAPAPLAPVALVPLGATRRGGRAPLGALGVLALLGLIAAAVAWAPLPSFRESAPAAAPDERTVAVGGLSLEVPGGWATAPFSAADVPGLAEPVAVLAPVPGLNAYAVVALTSRGVPPAFRRLVGRLGRSRPTTLAGAPARAYGPQAIPRDRVAQLTVARTSAGTLTVACLAPSSAWAGVAGCAEQVQASEP